MTTVSVITLDRISDALESIDLLEEMRSAFIAYSSGRAVIPPVGELIIDESPPGEVHIKYGYVRGGEHYVVKIASGFPGNHALGLPPGNGMMILFDVTSGAIASILLDEGHLTDIRTAAAVRMSVRCPSSSRMLAIAPLVTSKRIIIPFPGGSPRAWLPGNPEAIFTT